MKGRQSTSPSSPSTVLLAIGSLLVLSVFPLASTLRPSSLKKNSPGTAQRSNQQQKPIQVRSSLVQVDVLVTDKTGKRIENLNAGNFQLSEDNHLQKLAAADYFDVAKAGTSQDAEPIFVSLMNSNDSQTLRAIGRYHRLIVLFFDLSSFRPTGGGPDIDNLSRSVTAAKKFVKDQMTPADLVTIASFNTDLLVEADFTNDRQTLDQALDILLPKKGGQNVAQLGSLNNTLGRPPLVNTNNSLNAAQALAEMLALIPGRKSVIHFTGGLLQSGRESVLPALEGATDAANDGNVSFYEIDSRGLMTVCANASTGIGPAGASRGGPVICEPGPQFDGTRSAIGSLAQETGGALFIDMNDFTSFFKQVQDDSTGYYLLSYESSNQKHDGTYRHISVKLIGVPGGHIKYRPGYVAPKD
jgi:VWFA-related protein